MHVELAEALWLEQHRDVSLIELAELSGLSEAELRELVDLGAIAPIDTNATPWTFRGDCIAAVKIACRLRNDFELDAQGLALALSLLERIRALETELRALRAHLPRRTH